MTGVSRAPRILVVDDNEEITHLLAAWLIDVGVVHTATTTGQALALAKVVPPDLAIVDIVLPRMDGFALVTELRKQAPLHTLPVVFITGAARIDSEIRAVDAGASAVLYKPLDESLVRAAVLALLPHGAHDSAARSDRG